MVQTFSPSPANDFSLFSGESFYATVTLPSDTPAIASATCYLKQLRSDANAAALASLSLGSGLTIDNTGLLIDIALTPLQTAALPSENTVFYELWITTTAGDIYLAVIGRLTVNAA